MSDVSSYYNALKYHNCGCMSVSSHHSACFEFGPSWYENLASNHSSLCVPSQSNADGFHAVSEVTSTPEISSLTLLSYRRIIMQGKILLIEISNLQ